MRKAIACARCKVTPIDNEVPEIAILGLAGNQLDRILLAAPSRSD